MYTMGTASMRRPAVIHGVWMGTSFAGVIQSEWSAGEPTPVGSNAAEWLYIQKTMMQRRVGDQ
jgi:hypothetical protein